MILLSLDSRLFSEDLCNTQRKQNCWTVQSQEELEKHHRLPDYDFRKSLGHETVFYLDVQDVRHAVHVEVFVHAGHDGHATYNPQRRNDLCGCVLRTLVA